MRWPPLVLGVIAAAVVGIAGWQVWETEQLKIPKWIETDRPDCQTWYPYPQRNETATWSGTCQSGKAEGQGTLTWHYTDPAGNPLTETYSGGLLAGKTDGQGTAILPDGYRYDGMYKNGEKSGHGVAVRPSGARYDGEWQHDMPNGFGTFTTKDGRHYDGEWKQGCLDKDGVTLWFNTDPETCKKVLAK